MCHHRKTVFLCNHTVTNPTPLQACETQRDYESGLSPEPCDLMETHGRSNLRVPRLCPPCHAKKVRMDKTFKAVKERIAELRKHMETSYDQCMKHLDEAGLQPEKRPSPSVRISRTREKIAEIEKREKPVGSSATFTDAPGQLNPADFLRKKRQEVDAHLMMFWDHTR